jgi:tungstate transport system ATP-binding protein
MGLNLLINAVSKRYSGKTALRDCSFSFDQGVYALMGPNGSGKSTLLRVCALLESADTGKVTYAEGADALPHTMSLRRRITLVLPKVGVFNTTVFRNVAYGLTIRGIKRDELMRRAGAALDAVGLAHKMNQNALTLSSGETQRLGLARAMALEPEILFLDEPTASIDEDNTKIVEDIILTMKKGGRTTVIMSTHDREQAARLADTVVMMHEGRIIQQGM